MAADLEMEQRFLRLTLSPTIRRHQLRLPPIKTRPPKPAPFIEENHHRRGFVDELYEFPQPPSPSNPHITISSSPTQSDHQYYYREGSCSNNHPRFCSDELPHHHHHPKKTTVPAAAAGIQQQVSGTSECAAATGEVGRRFEDRFGDLQPAPIRWRLVEACETAMRELVGEVEKEMEGSTEAQTTLPEDVCMWRDVVAAAEVVGLDVREPKQHLIDAIRRLRSPHQQTIF